MARIPPHIIDDIMQTARIEEVIGQFVNLKRAGSNLKGLSPFTDEKTPSFVVSPAKQIFKCFSTGKGGNVVSFLMEKEHYSYPEALTWLADKYGIQLPEEKPATPEELAEISERESLHIINNFARDHFVNNMKNTTEGKNIGMSYFVERGFRPEIIEKFELGYCINKSDDFTSAALKKGYKLEFLEKVGLTKTKNDRSFDFFRGRVMFPIHSASGRVLGFGGRTLITDKKIAKYFNSPESIIYNKSKILYGLHFSKGDIIKYDNCFLCEGYTDVISMYQAGVTNVVASSGTALTKEQIGLIKRYTNNITILYDGDAAGIKASFRGIDLILEQGLNVKVILFPEGEDPDSYAKSVGTDELKEFLKENEQDFLSFKTDILLKDGSDDPIQRAGLIKEVVHSVSLIPDPITRKVFVQSIAKRFEMDEQTLNYELQVLLNKQQGINTPPPRPKTTAPTTEKTPEKTTKVKIDYNEFDLMRVLVLYGANALEFDQLNSEGKKETVEISVAELICQELEIDDLYFDEPIFAKLHQIIKDGINENVLHKPSFFLRSENQNIVHFVSEIQFRQREISQNWANKHNIFTASEKDKLETAVMGAIHSFKISKVEKRIQEIRLALHKNEISGEETMDLLAEQVALENVKKAIAKKMGRIIVR